MIVAENIKVTLNNNNTIFKNLTFSAGNGILSILGLNGQGKTTLLKTLAGLIKSETGKIHLGNTDISTLSYKHLACNIAFVPQEYSNVFSYTVREMVLMGRTPHIKNLNLPAKQDYEVTDTVIEEVGLSKFRNKYFTELSGGEKRLVLVARALAQQTDIILFDEPTTSLDIKNTFFVLEKINQLGKEKTIIITLHDLNQTLHCADNILILFPNDTFAFGSKNEILTEENLIELE
jgi:iron complex transport system ATP-binding protein